MTKEERARFQENNKTGRPRLHYIRMQSREDFPLFASYYSGKHLITWPHHTKNSPKLWSK